MSALYSHLPGGTWISLKKCLCVESFVNQPAPFFQEAFHTGVRAGGSP